MVDWNPISIASFVYQVGKDVWQGVSSRKNEAAITSTIPSTEKESDSYQVILGKRHKYLREEVLQLNPRQMSNFYGFEKVSYLEDCEAGLDEFPTESIKRLEETFFISPEYLQEGSPFIFKSFDIIGTKDTLRFLEEGFDPHFLCSPTFEEDGEAFIVFQKEDLGYWRMIKSNTICGFYSSGGGLNNILNLINAMLELDLARTWSNILFMNVRMDEWGKLCSLCWYQKGRLGYSSDKTRNIKARNIFEPVLKSHEEYQQQLPDLSPWK
jgi:hypothetical protein